MKINLSNYKKEQVKEALERMKEFQMSPDIIDNFANGEIMISLSGKPGTVVKEAEDAQAALDSLKTFDDMMPYHIIKSHTVIGDQYTILCVSEEHMDYSNSAGKENGYIPPELPDHNGELLTWVYNASNPKDAGEMGVVIEKANGTLVRIG